MTTRPNHPPHHPNPDHDHASRRADDPHHHTGNGTGTLLRAPLSGQWQARAPGGGRDSQEEPDQAEQARLWATARLKELVESLRPYIDGTLGDISPRHAAVYVTAVKEINRLWSAYFNPSIVKPNMEDLEREEALEAERVAEQARITRDRVLDQLRQLRDRSGDAG
jgi:hypothetical protein